MLGDLLGEAEAGRAGADDDDVEPGAVGAVEPGDVEVERLRSGLGLQIEEGVEFGGLGDLAVFSWWVLSDWKESWSLGWE